MKRIFTLLILIAFAVSAPLSAQNSKCSLTHEDYDSWRSITSSAISRDGAWIRYIDAPQDGDGKLVVIRLSDRTEYTCPIGYTGEGTNAGSSARPEFSYDGEKLVFLISRDKETVNKDKKDKKKKDEKKKDEKAVLKLGIMDLSSGEVTVIDSVKSFAMPEEEGGWLAYLKVKPKKKEKDKEKSEEEKEAKPGEEGKELKEKEEDKEEEKKKKDFGSPLVVRDLKDGSEKEFADILEFKFTKNGRLFLIVSSEEKPEEDGLYNVAIDGSLIPLLKGEGNYKQWTLNKDETVLAFLSDKDDYEADDPVFNLYGVRVGQKAATLWISRESAGFPDGMAVNDKSSLTFSKDGSVLMFSVKEAPEPEDDKDSDDEAEEKAKFDLWHWNDPYPQPQQIKMAESVRENGPEYVFFPKNRKLVRLGDANIIDISLSRNGKAAYANHKWPYTKHVSYFGTFNDVYVFDTKSGSKKLVKKELYGNASMSPGAKYMLWFEKGDWFVYSINTGKTVNLTRGINVSFEMEDWDTPNPPRAYGRAGWTDNDDEVLIYDKYDIWAFKPDGSGKQRLFNGYGRKNDISLRYHSLDPEAVTIDPNEALLFRTTNLETMASGFYRAKISDAKPVQLIMEDKSFGFPSKAKNADRLIFTRSAFDEYPDLWVSDLNFDKRVRITDLGKQMDPFIWGQSELVDFKSADGMDLKGILIKPDNFDPDKKYPLLVTIYETLHTGLHRYRNPSPGTSPNPSYYVSNGYVMWMPDIEYHTGYPGKDALKCVLPGINLLVSKGYIDPEKIGIAGHSWGGYQIAYMITQTDIFAAVESGAPVSNMTSAYGGIRWGTGMVRQFQYERTQSRLGGTLWEVPLRYLENSPVFWADKVNTPILMIHNDKDGAVPWYQGIEYIMALRRLEKEAYMFNYNGEDHGLRKRVNMKDWTIRIQEFFDHHLRGEEAPEWMKNGIKAWEKEEEEE